MIDLKLVNDPNAIDNHDLVVENYDLQLTSDIDSIRQSLSIRLQFFFSEWFLEVTQGIDFYSTVLVKTPDLGLVLQ